MDDRTVPPGEDPRVIFFDELGFGWTLTPPMLLEFQAAALREELLRKVEGLTFIPRQKRILW